MENILLSNNIISRYNMMDTKISVDYLMEQYRIFQYKWSSIVHPKITTNYEISYSCYIPRKADPVGDFAMRKIESEKEAKRFFIDITRVTNQFTHEEKVYYVNKYFKNKPEEEIARELNRSRNGISQIKYSCILKLAFAFGEEILKMERR